MPLQNLSGKVTPEVFEQFKTANGNSEATTFNQFVELLLEAFLNPKTKPVEVIRPSAEQLEEIQLKDNEIGRLKTDVSLKAQEIEAMAEECRLLTRMLDEAKQNVPPQPEPVDLTSEQIVLTIPPIIMAVLDIEREVAKKKSGKDFSFSDLLLNNFWESIVNGVSHPFRIWSNSELAKLAKQIKEVVQ